VTRKEGETDARPALRASLSRAIFHRRFGLPERVLRWRVPAERQTANDGIPSNILESPGYFVADIKLGCPQMAKPRPIQFRAVHTKKRWRPADHETEKHALVGSSSTDIRSARALFDYRNTAISYAVEGSPKYVVVWDPSSDSGTIVRADSSEPDGLRRARITIEEIQRIEQGSRPSDAELERYFVRAPRALPVPKAETIEEINADFEKRLAGSLAASQTQRLQRLANADPLPPRVEVRTTVFVRNTDVVAEVLHRAGGVCEGCREAAPFSRASTGEPYLEVHHRVPLSLGGPDTVDNGVALCPNCHRQRHYGRSAT
jgi:hypothetical protein